MRPTTTRHRGRWTVSTGWRMARRMGSRASMPTSPWGPCRPGRRCRHRASSSEEWFCSHCYMMIADVEPLYEDIHVDEHCKNTIRQHRNSIAYESHTSAVKSRSIRHSSKHVAPARAAPSSKDRSKEAPGLSDGVKVTPHQSDFGV